ncbi:MAG: dihydrodipicolinate synthase family protein [Actinobacteria bacterium]|nr:dihydrodipicolinate synthase family protein [Actinomycetota bacterium]
MSTEVVFEGILPALITPLTEDASEVDHAALGALVEGLVGTGVTGLVPCGSTGEFVTLTDAERRAVIETTIEAAVGRVPVVPHTGALSTAATVALSVHAERAGAAAVMVVPPFYEQLTSRELLAHFAAVAEAVTVPLMYYNLPGATGVELSFEEFQELQRTARVQSLKDTSGDAVAGMELIQRDAEGPTLLNGLDTLTFSSFAAGARAAIWGAANFLPREAVELHRLLVRDRDLDGARELWRRIYPICAFLESGSYTAAVKEACDLVGLAPGGLRGPLLPLEPERRAALAALLEAAGIEPVGAGR